MADARSRAEWGRTSSLMALLANCHRDARRRRAPYRPSHFDPYHRPARRAGKGGLGDLAMAVSGLAKRRKAGLAKQRPERHGQPEQQADGDLAHDATAG
jgi:hypothetical protein